MLKSEAFAGNSKTLQQESLPMLAGDYYYVACYDEGVIKRWLSDLGIAYRGDQIETITDEGNIPEVVTKRFYN